MTLPNWMIRCIIAVLALPLIVIAAVWGACDYVVNEAWCEIRERWKHPEDTRWGKNRRRA